MNVDEALKDCKNELLNESVVKEYFRLLSLIKSDELLSSLQKQIIEHQKLMSLNMNVDEVYFKEKEKYECLLNEYNANPLIVDFNIIKEEISVLLKEVLAELE